MMGATSCSTLLKNMTIAEEHDITNGWFKLEE
jgi:hypothetical protein